jgi:hypothetical protein
MSSTDTSGFGKFVPGFEFLQNLAKGSGGSTAAAMPNLSQWLVPSLNVEDLEKRIEELKHVQFWLEQNSRALSATIQALEVQKLTMATLKGMNFTMGMPGAQTTTAAAPGASGWPKPQATPPEQSAPEAAPASAAQPEPAASATAQKPAAGVVDPLQLWGSLTQQFQTIAANAFKEVSEQVAASQPATPKASVKKVVAKKVAAKKVTAKKATARKTAAKKSPARKSGTPTPTRRRVT